MDPQVIKHVLTKIAVLITGSINNGKSILASAFEHQACQLRFKVLNANTMRLFAQMNEYGKDRWIR
jgi:DNA replication protein DnaC